MLIRCNTFLWAKWEELASKKKKVPDDKRFFNTEMLKCALDILIVEICTEPWFAHQPLILSFMADNFTKDDDFQCFVSGKIHLNIFEK